VLLIANNPEKFGIHSKNPQGDISYRTARLYIMNHIDLSLVQVPHIFMDLYYSMKHGYLVSFVTNRVLAF